MLISQLLQAAIQYLEQKVAHLVIFPVAQDTDDVMNAGPLSRLSVHAFALSGQREMNYVLTIGIAGLSEQPFFLHAGDKF